jgi:ubiquinone/menaquinone biosynthesis C-methylase UbiE
MQIMIEFKKEFHKTIIKSAHKRFTFKILPLKPKNSIMNISICKRLLIALLCLLSVFIFSIKTVYAEEKRFCFAVMGCMHLGACSFDDYKTAVELIKSYEPDFLLFLGGMIDIAGEEPLEDIWQRFNDITNSLGVKTYDVPSNCSLVNSSFSEDRVNRMQHFFTNKYNKRYYSFEHKNNIFIGLDGNKLMDEIRQQDLASEQLQFIGRTVLESYDFDNVFVFLHDSVWFQKNGPMWFESVHPALRNKVKYVFGAGKHYIDLHKVDDIIYITSGTPPCYMERYSGKSSFFHFLIVDVYKNGAVVRIVPVEPISLENLGSSLVQQQPSFFTLESDKESHGVVKPYLLSSYVRESMLIPDLIIDTLKIKPDMDILDIGAGTGFFTFRFADALNGTGRVFATDIDQKMISYINDKAQKEGYENIFTKHVEPQTADALYENNSFDIIFLSEVYQYLRYPEDYFRQLRHSLVSEKGSLYIIHSKNAYGFVETEFEDFKDCLQVIAKEGENYPVFRKLSSSVQDFVRSWKGQEAPLEIRKTIVSDFNKILLDRFLFYDLMDYYTAKGVIAGEGEWSAPLMLITSPEDIKLAKWLFVALNKAGAFENNAQLTDNNMQYLRRLNRILLTKTFEGFMRIPDIQGELGGPIYVDENSIIHTLEKAGYKLANTYDFLTHHHFLEFKRKD